MYRAPEPTKPTFSGEDPTKTKGFVEKAQAWLEVYVADGWFPAPAAQVKALKGLLVDASPAELWSRTVSASTPDEWLTALSEFFAHPLEWENLSSNLQSVKWKGSLRQLCVDVKSCNLLLEPPDRLSVKWLVGHILFRCPSALKPKVRSAVQGVTTEDALWSQLANVAGLGVGGERGDAGDMHMDLDAFGGANVKCFKCGSPGHMARNCLKSGGAQGGKGGKGACFNCGDSGHYVRECPKADRGGKGKGKGGQKGGLAPFESGHPPNEDAPFHERAMGGGHPSQ
jgi:hypothetical protein